MSESEAELVAIFGWPGAGFSFTLDRDGTWTNWQGSSGFERRMAGTWKRSGDDVTLEACFRYESSDFMDPAEWKPASEILDYVVYRWGERRYLVRKDSRAAFALAFDDGALTSDRDQGLAILRRIGDEKLPISGFPDVPPDEVHLLRPIAFRMQISDVIEQHRRVRGNAGRAEGIAVGMRFRVQGSRGWLLPDLIAIAVGDHDCSLESAWRVSPRFEGNLPSYGAGQWLSTRVDDVQLRGLCDRP